MDKSVLAALARQMGAHELADTIEATTDSGALRLAAAGLLALCGQDLENIGHGLEKQGDRIGGAKAKSAGRAARAKWDAANRA